MKTSGKRPPQVTEEGLQAAVRVCTNAGADLVYLFGSQPRGKAWAESDVDVAVLLGPSVPKERYGAVRAQLISELMSVFGSNDVDVVTLNQASPLLTYAGVIRGGAAALREGPAVSDQVRSPGLSAICGHGSASRDPEPVPKAGNSGRRNALGSCRREGRPIDGEPSYPCAVCSEADHRPVASAMKGGSSRW